MQDITRQGAMRVKSPGTAEFLGADKYAVPPVMTLRELESVAWELSNQKHEDLTSLRRWFAVLVAPGGVLGGGGSPEGKLCRSRWLAVDWQIPGSR